MEAQYLTRLTRSVITYQANGNKNGGKVIDHSSVDTLIGITDDAPSVAGVFRLPVCSSQVAVKNWNAGNRTAEYYPC